MKTLLALITILVLSGCAQTVPVKAKFPEMPQTLRDPCPALEKLDGEPKLSDVAKTLTHNYTTYYQCAAKHEAVIEWYTVQKKIFEGIK